METLKGANQAAQLSLSRIKEQIVTETDRLLAVREDELQKLSDGYGPLIKDGQDSLDKLRLQVKAAEEQHDELIAEADNLDSSIAKKRLALADTKDEVQTARDSLERLQDSQSGTEYTLGSLKSQQDILEGVKNNLVTEITGLELEKSTLVDTLDGLEATIKAKIRVCDEEIEERQANLTLEMETITTGRAQLNIERLNFHREVEEVRADFADRQLKLDNHDKNLRIREGKASILEQKNQANSQLLNL